jgi:hypothetical protein
MKRGGITSALREFMTPEKIITLIEKLYDRAARLGDMRAVAEILNRLEGPVAAKPLEIPGGMEVQAVVGIVLRSLEDLPEARVRVSSALAREAKKLDVKPE